MPILATMGERGYLTATRTRVVGIVALLTFGSLSATACRYNVRDLGFIDLEAALYRLHVVPGAALNREQAQQVRGAAELAFRDSNVALDLHDPGFTPGPDEPWRGSWPVAAEARGADGTQAILVAPDGSTRPVQLGAWDTGLEERLSALVRSPIREALVAHAAEGYAAVLFVEGTDPAANTRALQVVQEAITEAQNQMRWLPKPIAHPPALVTLARANAAAESLLLWALGVDERDTPAPAVAMVYGKARRIGEVLRGEGIRAAALQRVFTTIGADCECGLDLSWTRGKPLPVRWTPARHTQVAKSLGFDPENPAVKLEATQILGKRAKPTTPKLGYQEISLDDDAGPSATPAAVLATAVPTAKPAAPTPAQTVEYDLESRTRSSWVRSLALLVAVASGVVLGGTLWLVRARSRE